MARSIAWLGLAAALVATGAKGETSFKFCIGKNCPKGQFTIETTPPDPWQQPTRSDWPVAPRRPPPQMRPIGDSGFASDPEVQAAVGSRRLDFDCPASRDIDGLDNSTVYQRGARVYFAKANPEYHSDRIKSSVLRDALSAVWDKCPISSTPPFGGSTQIRYEVGFVDLFAAGSAAPTLVMHAERFSALGGNGNWGKLTDIGEQQERERIALAAQEQRRQEASARAEAERQQQATAWAAQQAATAERQRLQAAAHLQAQQIAAIRAQAGARWWGGFWLLLMLGVASWLTIKYHEPILRWYFLLTPMPANFNFDDALSEPNSHLSGPAIFVKFRLHAEKIKMEAWTSRLASQEAALKQAGLRDAQFDKVREERIRAKVHREDANVENLKGAEQEAVVEKIEGIKHQAAMSATARREQIADRETDALVAEQARDKFIRGHNGANDVQPSAAERYREEHRKLRGTYEELKKVAEEDADMDEEERKEEFTRLRLWYRDQRHHLLETFKHT
jgi:hypothetical protein